MCNPLFALQILLTTGHLFFSLLPIPQCLLSPLHTVLRTARVLYKVYSTVPLGSLLSVAERGLDSVVFIVERLGPLFAHFQEVPAADYANQPSTTNVFFGIPGFT